MRCPKTWTASLYAHPQYLVRLRSARETNWGAIARKLARLACRHPHLVHALSSKVQFHPKSELLMGPPNGSDIHVTSLHCRWQVTTIILSEVPCNSYFARGKRSAESNVICLSAFPLTAAMLTETWIHCGCQAANQSTRLFRHTISTRLLVAAGSC
jgi:hypothetical protein